MMKQVEEAVKSFQHPSPEQFNLDAILGKSRESLPPALRENSGTEREGEPGEAIYYFFSFSLPRDLIMARMKEAIALKHSGKKVLMLLRGFVGNSLDGTVKTFAGYSKELAEDMPVEIDPELFDSYGIAGVPAVVGRRSGEAGILRGDQAGISYAAQRFEEEGYRDYGLYGRLYPIGEEDILKVLQARAPMAEAAIRRELPEIRRKALGLDRYDGYFKKAEKDRVYYVDPRVTLSEDITLPENIHDERGNIIGHKGQLIGRKGQVLDPSSLGIRLGRYVVIDGRDRTQVDFAVKGNFDLIMISGGDAGALMAERGVPVYFVTDEIISRFKLERVPAVIEQEGSYVKITEKPV